MMKYRGQHNMTQQIAMQSPIRLRSCKPSFPEGQQEHVRYEYVKLGGKDAYDTSTQTS
jgi:hypothetical protein